MPCNCKFVLNQIVYTCECLKLSRTENAVLVSEEMRESERWDESLVQRVDELMHYSFALIGSFVDCCLHTYPLYFVRRSIFFNLPVAVCGNSFTNSTASGTHHLATRDDNHSSKADSDNL